MSLRPTFCSFLNAREPSIDRRCRPLPSLHINLENLINEETLSESNSSTGGTSSSVYLRLRPIATSKCGYNEDIYSVNNSTFIARNLQETQTNANRPSAEKQYSFTNVFTGTTSQHEIYASCIQKYIEVEKSTNILTYGTSGSGKTFTLLGTDQNPGIIPRAFCQIYTQYANNIWQVPLLKLVDGEVTLLTDEMIEIEEAKRKSILRTPQENSIIGPNMCDKENIAIEHNFKTKNHPDKTVYIWMSFAEIYNESVYDLLTNSQELDMAKRTKLKIASNSDLSYIKNLKSIYVKNCEEAYSVLNYGLQRVSYGSTLVNSNSSRSHIILFIDLIIYEGSGDFYHTTYRFCDLAGSERTSKTKSSNTRLREANHINKSLMVLGRCLSILHSNDKKKKTVDMVPFRDSKLTLLLKSALLGNEAIAMIVNLFPDVCYHEENLHVLNFSSIAKQIVQRLPPPKHRKTRYSMFLAQATSSPQKKLAHDEEELLVLKHENAVQAEEIHYLRQKVEKLNRQECELRYELIAEFKRNLKESNDLWTKRIEYAEDKEKKHMEKIKQLKLQLIRAQNSPPNDTAAVFEDRAELDHSDGDADSESDSVEMSDVNSIDIPDSDSVDISESDVDPDSSVELIRE